MKIVNVHNKKKRNEKNISTITEIPRKNDSAINVFGKETFKDALLKNIYIKKIINFEPKNNRNQKIENSGSLISNGKFIIKQNISIVNPLVRLN